MPRIQPARTDQDYITHVYPVAASQTIAEGDPVKIANGLISKALVSDTAIFGFAVHAITTDASSNTVPGTTGSYSGPADGYSSPDRGLLVYVAQAPQKFSGELSTAASASVALTLVESLAGFIVENGYAKIDPSATVKPFRINSIHQNPGLSNIVEISVLAANRVEE